MGMHVLKPTFTRGELSPLAHARRDIDLYQGAAEQLLNWIVLKEGGVRRRSGTMFMGRTKYDDRDTRLIDFVFSAEQAYSLEVGHEYVRFWTGPGFVEDPMSPGDPYEVVSQYTEADLRDIQWEQSGDVLYVALRSMTKKPKKLVRLANDDWAFQDIVFKDGPYLPLNDAANEVTPSATPATSSTSDLAFATTANINGGSGFLSTDVGRHFRAQFGGEYSWGTITVVTDDKHVTVAWEEGNGGGTTPSKTWRLGAFSDTTGYPGSVAIFDGRLVWGSTPTNPRFIGFSYSNLPEVYTPTDHDAVVTDAHGGAYDIIAGDEILWLQEAVRLQIAMPRTIRSLGASDTQQQFGPRNISVKIEINEGAAKTRPVVVGPSTIHAARFGHALNDLYYDYQVNSLVRPELSTANEHLYDSSVKEFTFQQMPQRRLWSLLEDGSLTCTTIERYEKVIGFVPVDFGGAVISMASVPGLSHDELWLVVRRTIDEQQVQYVEKLQPDFLRGDIEDAFFVDCGSTYEGAATNTVTGIDWLENETVSILADGRVLPDQVVSGAGVLTLPADRTASKITFGLSYESRGKLLRTPLQTNEGDSLGRKVKVVEVEADVYETKGLRFISDRGTDDELRERPASKAQAGNGLMTGTFRVLIDGSWTSEGQFSFVTDQPLPATVRALNVHIQTE